MTNTKVLGDRVLQIYCDIVKTANNSDSKIYGGAFDETDNMILQNLALNQSACASLAVEIFKQELKLQKTSGGMYGKKEIGED